MKVTQMKLTGGKMPVSTPEAQGIPSEAILDFLDEIEKNHVQLHAFQIVRHGQLVASAVAAPYTMDSFHRICSAAKGIVATAMLIAIQEGRFDFDTPAVKLLDEKHLPEDMDARWERLTVYHLLTMHTGHREDTFFEMFGGKSEHWVRTFFEIKPDYEPGTVFCYDMGAQYVMNEIIHHTTGTELGAYLQPRLLEPMGIELQYDFTEPEGLFFSSHIQFKPDALTKLSQLYLQGGVWEGRQLVRDDLVEMASAPQSPCAYYDSDFGNYDAEDNAGYALHMWRNSVGGFRFCGGQGQFGVILPEYDMVFSSFGGEDRLNLILDYFFRNVLRSCHYRPLPENGQAWARLQRRLSGFSTAIKNLSDRSSTAERVSGVRYVFEPNEEGQISVCFTFEPERVMIGSVSARGEKHHACGLGGRWEKCVGYLLLDKEDGEILDLDHILFYDDRQTLLTGGWLERDRFAFTLRSPAMMCGYSYVCEFFGDMLELTISTSAHAPVYTHMGQAAFNETRTLRATKL